MCAHSLIILAIKYRTIETRLHKTYIYVYTLSYKVLNK